MLEGLRDLSKPRQKDSWYLAPDLYPQVIVVSLYYSLYQQMSKDGTVCTHPPHPSQQALSQSSAVCPPRLPSRGTVLPTTSVALSPHCPLASFGLPSSHPVTHAHLTPDTTSGERS